VNEPDPSAESLPSHEKMLVLAMPRRELYRFSGFSSAVDLQLLESLANEAWYTAPAILAGSLDAKEVSLGLVFERGDCVLINAVGAILHTSRLGSDVAKMGRGIKILRDLALLAGARFVGVDRVRCELAGFLNEDAIPGYKNAMVLVYRCRVPEEAGAPPGTAWVPRQKLTQIPVDAISAMIADVLYQVSPSTT
jgi:hypothetical protein